MKVLITGATGMIGSLILNHCFESEKITKIISIARRKTNLTHPKLTEVIPKSFLDYRSNEQHFQNVDAAFYCLGAYTGAVADDQFKTITFDYTQKFAEALKEGSPNAMKNTTGIKNATQVLVENSRTQQFKASYPCGLIPACG